MTDQKKTSSASEVLFGGSCACGRITYSSTALPTTCQTCHCVTCCKVGGGAFKAYSDVLSKQVTFYDNKGKLRYEGLPKDSIGGITFLRLMPGAERAFCVDCHSELAMRYYHDYEQIGMPTGTIDEDTIRYEAVKEALKPKSHIFADQNPWWFDISLDGLPCRARFGGDFEERMNAKSR